MSLVNEENYITIQGWMRTELGLKGNDLLVYALIYGFSQTKDQKFTGSLQYIADWCGATKQGVQKNLKNLIDNNLIQKFEYEKNGVKFCQYSCIPYNSVVQGIQLSCTNNINNNIVNKVLISKDISTRENFLGSSSKKQSNNSLYSKCVAMLDDFVITHNLDNEVRKQLIEYLNFRLQVKDKPLYANMWKGMLNKLATLCSEGHNVYDIIQFCIERGYLSFYPPSDNTNSKVRLCDRDVITTEPTEQDRKWLREMKEKGEVF